MLQWIREHRYSLAGLYLFVFLAGFFLVEQVVPEPPEHIIHCIVDDWIPFNEWFVLPYFLWYLWVPACMIYFMIKERGTYLRLCFIMFAGATLCLIFYVLWPNGLDLRREITSSNFCASIVRFVRSVDSPCNVCPSIHVSSTVAIHLAILRSDAYRKNRALGLLSLVVTVAICVSTVFIKQHSVIDVFWGWALSWGLARGMDKILYLFYK